MINDLGHSLTFNSSEDIPFSFLGMTNFRIPVLQKKLVVCNMSGCLGCYDVDIVAESRALIFILILLFPLFGNVLFNYFNAWLLISCYGQVEGNLCVLFV